MKTHKVKIYWSYGHTDIKEFKTKEEMHDYLEIRQDDIDYVVKNPIVENCIIMKALGVLDTEMTDYEMDMYL